MMSFEVFWNRSTCDDDLLFSLNDVAAFVVMKESMEKRTTRDTVAWVRQAMVSRSRGLQTMSTT